MIPLSPAYKRQVWDYKKIHAECTRRSIYIVGSNFLFQGTSVNQKVMIFNKNLMNIFHNHNFIPNKIIVCSYKCFPPWMTDDIKNRLRQRDRERSKMTKKYNKYVEMKSHLDELQEKTDECAALKVR